MEERYINLVKSVLECPTGFVLDCLIGLKNSHDPLDRQAYDDAVTFMTSLHDKLERVLRVVCMPEMPKRTSSPEDDPFTP
jgi:hypothetical protein